MNLHTDHQSLHAALTLMTGVIYCEKIMVSQNWSVNIKKI